MGSDSSGECLPRTRKSARSREVAVADLRWHCVDCGDDEPIDPKGHDVYELGSWEKCECGGQVYVMTLKQGACYEQGRALGMTRAAALARAGCPAASELLPQRPQDGGEEET
jgi:hypothetical protein